MATENSEEDKRENEEPETKEAKTIDDGISENETSVSGTNDRNKLKRLARILLFLPYIIGILWTCLHPIASVITGELKCRGWYLDEHSIETRFIEGQTPHEAPSHLKSLKLSPLRQPRNGGKHSLCDFFAREGDPGFNANNLICHTHGDNFEVAMIMPLSNALDATEEAIVLVVPSPEEVYNLSVTKDNQARDWSSSRLHQAMVQSIKHLADPVETTWLAKTVLVVTPTMSSSGNNHQSLDDTVSSFLDAYLGQQNTPQDFKSAGQRRNDEVPPLPTRLSGAILRNLVVLDVSDKSTPKSATSRSGGSPKTDLAILPQGRRGILPNADLVFLVGKLMERTLFYRQSSARTFLAHPYTQESKDWALWVDQWVLKHFGENKNMALQFSRWAQGMVDVSLFARTLAVGPVPPHAAALDRGIDSLTLRVAFDGTFRRDPAVEFVQFSEYIVRSLANLHERLHHSFTLYLLPSPKTFVSHIEYLLPIILVLVPLAVRAFGHVLPAMKGGFDLKAVGAVLLILVIASVAMLLADVVSSTFDHKHTMSGILLFLYTSVAILWTREILFRKQDRRQPDSKESTSNGKEKENDKTPNTTRTIRSLQYVACALTVYILVPIAFAHASLAYLPSFLWTPLLAFPDYASLKRSGDSVHKYVAIPMLLLLVWVTAPPVFLVPNVFSTYTVFEQESPPDAVLKRKPVSLRRKSFGGQTGVGIYWRRRAVPTSVREEEEKDGAEPGQRERDNIDATSNATIASSSKCNSQDPETSMKPKATVKKSAAIPVVDRPEDMPLIGWDDDLCRPIYYHRSVSSDDSAMLSNDDNANDATVDEDLLDPSCHDSTVEGSVPDEESAGTHSVADPKTDTLETTKDEEALLRIPAFARKRTGTFGNRGKRQRPLSLILRQGDLDDMDNEEGATTSLDQESRRVSLESSADVSSNDQGAQGTVGQGEDKEFDSHGGDTLKVRADDLSSKKASNKPDRKRRSKKCCDAEEKLEKARDYFAKLDQTQKLTLDANSSPTVSSRVTRTSRRTNLNSPRINREYQAYAESIRGCGESGLSPLSIRDYAASRRIHFENKGEIVDGFLDD
eukprot:jgi/Psemu1/65159/estExt_Genemark1.C_1070013